MATILEWGGLRPRLGPGVYLAAGARLIGAVELGEQSSVWCNAVLRGDINRVVIGRFSNLQDLSVCHVADEWPCVVGDYVTVGHSAILHGCVVGDEVLVGMGAILMNGVTVGAQSIIGAGALLTEGLQVPPGSLVYGSPARVVSQLGTVERQKIRSWAEKYARLAATYRVADEGR
jgi:carbonic anhydrase/acetyltransferase-like protein (isoleucine patch superfamily)